MKILAAILISVTLAGAVVADPPETREYRIVVDGKPAGSYTMTVLKKPDGTVEQTGHANVSLRVFIKTFTYSYRGKETWKDGKLIRLESQTNDDGKGYQVSADAAANGLQVAVNGRATFAPADVWTMTYWQLPPVSRRDGEILLLDTDTGRVLRGRIKPFGPATAYVAGVATPVNRYQVSGAARADLWYDGAERLIRQETIEDGYRTVIELVRVAK